MQKPGKGELGDGGAVFPGGLIQSAARAGHLAGRQRKPRDETHGVLGAVVEDHLALAVAEIVQILDTYYRDDLSCLLDFRDRHLRQADMADLARRLEFLERPERLGCRDLRVDAVKLVEIDA